MFYLLCFCGSSSGCSLFLLNRLVFGLFHGYLSLGSVLLRFGFLFLSSTVHKPRFGGFLVFVLMGFFNRLFSCSLMGLCFDLQISCHFSSTHLTFDDFEHFSGLNPHEMILKTHLILFLFLCIT